MDVLDKVVAMLADEGFRVVPADWPNQPRDYYTNPANSIRRRGDCYMRRVHEASIGVSFGDGQRMYLRAGHDSWGQQVTAHEFVRLAKQRLDGTRTPEQSPSGYCVECYRLKRNDNEEEEQSESMPEPGDALPMTVDEIIEAMGVAHQDA